MEDVGSEMTEENDAAADEDETEEEAVNEESRLEDDINNETNISPKALKIRCENYTSLHSSFFLNKKFTVLRFICSCIF